MAPPPDAASEERTAVYCLAPTLQGLWSGHWGGSLALWDAAKGQPIPIGYGVMSADELQDRIYLLTSKEAGHDY